MTDNEMLALRAAIRRKYEAYRLTKPGKYPTIKFNSYPTPYEHLRISFTEELATHGKADMQEALAHIPSTKTFAKIFHEGYILKDEKVINTCYLYAWGQPRDTGSEAEPISVLPPVPDPAPAPTPSQITFIRRPYRRNLLLVSLLILAGLGVYVAGNYYRSALSPNKLVIVTPTNGMTVPRVMIANGRASSSGSVWLVVHPAGHPEYYVQAPMKVTADGTWEGPLYTGNRDPASVGVRSQLRAFVNPAKALIEDQVIYSWPKAELSSDLIEVTRGPQDIQYPATP